MEGSCAALASSLSYKTGAPGVQQDVVNNIRGEGEPRRDTVGLGGTSGAERGTSQQVLQLVTAKECSGAAMTAKRPGHLLVTGWFCPLTAGMCRQSPPVGDGTGRQLRQPDISASPPPFLVLEQLQEECSA